MSYIRGSFLACTGLLTLLLCAPARPAAAESLGDAVAAALNNHPAVEAAFANRNAYDEEENEKYSNYFPKLSAGLTGGRLYGDNSTSRGLSVTRGAGYSWLGEGTLTVSQMLFDGFETSRRVNAADSRVQSAVATIAEVREELALKTVLAYLDVLRTREAVASLQEHNIKIADYRQRIQKMVAEGAADRSMESQARDIQIQLETTMADLRAQERAAIAQYFEMTGREPKDGMEKPAVPAALIPADVTEAIKIAQNSSPSIKAMILTNQGLAYDAKAEESVLYPDVNADLSYLKSDKEDILGGEAIDARAVVKLNWNFSTGGAELARIRKAKYRALESKAQAEEARRQIAREISVAWTEIDKAQALYDLSKERETVTAELFSNYMSQFEGARINLLQLLQADNGYFNARLALMNADYRLIAARFNAMSTMGRMQEALDIVPAAVARDGD